VVEGFGVEDHMHLHLVPINAGCELDTKHQKVFSDEQMDAVMEGIRSYI